MRNLDTGNSELLPSMFNSSSSMAYFLIILFFLSHRQLSCTETVCFYFKSQHFQHTILPKLEKSSGCLDPFNDLGVCYEGSDFRPFAYKAFCKFQCVNDCKFQPTRIVLSNLSCIPDLGTSYPYNVELTCKCKGKRANGKKTETCYTGRYTWSDVERLYELHCKNSSPGNYSEGMPKNDLTTRTSPSSDGQEPFQVLIELMRRSSTDRTMTVAMTTTRMETTPRMTRAITRTTNGMTRTSKATTTTTTRTTKATRTTMETKATTQTMKKTIGASTEELATTLPGPPAETAAWGKEALAWNQNNTGSNDYYYVYMGVDSLSKKNTIIKNTSIMIFNRSNDSLMNNVTSLQHLPSFLPHTTASLQQRTSSLPHHAPSLPDHVPWLFKGNGAW